MSEATAASAVEPKARSAKDFFSELVKGSQPRPGYLAERDRWLRSIRVDGREELLFELEMLLRGVERYFNLHNLPLDPEHPPVVTRDFKDELIDVRDALDQAIRVARRLLDPQSDQLMQFRKYVESQLLSDDRARRELIEQELDQDTPQEALFVLRQAFESLRTVIDQLLRADVCGYALFSEIGNLALREIVLNRFFRPFRPLEFRLEYDRIRSAALLEALVKLSRDARRFYTVALLALFRLLHYLSYLGDEDRAGAPRARVVLALVRSEAATLVRFLRADAAPRLSDKRLHVGALKIARDVDREVQQIVQKMLESRPGEGGECGAAVALTELFRRQIVTAAHILSPELRGPELFEQLVSPADMAERLRMDLWALVQLVRSAQAAFAVDSSDAAMDALTYLREYLGYFQDVSYHLLRYGDFEAFDRFTGIVLSLDLPPDKGGDRARLAEECRLFARVASSSFANVSRRFELAGRKFDRVRAEELRARFLR